MQDAHMTADRGASLLTSTERSCGGSIPADCPLVLLLEICAPALRQLPLQGGAVALILTSTPTLALRTAWVSPVGSCTSCESCSRSGSRLSRLGGGLPAGTLPVLLACWVTLLSWIGAAVEAFACAACPCAGAGCGAAAGALVPPGGRLSRLCGRSMLICCRPRGCRVPARDAPEVVTGHLACIDLHWASMQVMAMAPPLDAPIAARLQRIGKLMVGLRYRPLMTSVAQHHSQGAQGPSRPASNDVQNDDLGKAG